MVFVHGVPCSARRYVIADVVWGITLLSLSCLVFLYAQVIDIPLDSFIFVFSGVFILSWRANLGDSKDQGLGFHRIDANAGKTPEISPPLSLLLA